jgi:hypothetical protein
MTTLTAPDYTTELTEIARGSEDGCAVFDWDKLTRKQRNALQSIMWISGQLSGDISYGNFIVRITQQKMVSVLQNPVAIPEKDIY